MSETIELPKIAGVNLASATASFSVEAYNNDITPFADVVDFLMKTCGYDQATSEMYAIHIHRKGKAICFWGTKGACLYVIEGFKGIGVDAKLLEV